MIRVFYTPCGKTYKEQHTAAYELLYAAADVCKLKGGRVEKTEDGKPYFSDAEGTFFSLSHGCGYALCAIGTEPCGIDIEDESRVTESIKKRYLNAEDGSPSDMSWTEKESYGKLNGKGFFAGTPARNIAFKSFCLDGFTVTVCVYAGTKISPLLEKIEIG